MRKIASLGAALLIGGALVGGAAPAQAQPDCVSQLVDPICAAVNRQIQNVEEELGHVPEYIQHAYDTAYELYNAADRTIRCVVFGECA